MTDTTNSTQPTILDLDAFLDSTMDNVPDVPDFLNPPDGNYALKVIEAKIEEYSTKAEPTVKKNRIRIQYAVEATIETKEVPVPDGSMFSENFTATEDGLKYFKKRALGIFDVSDMNGVPVRDILTNLKGAEFKARLTTKITKSKDGQSDFENVNIRVLSEAADRQAAMDAAG